MWPHASKEGDEVKVMLFEIDSQGRNNLSVKRVQELEEGDSSEEETTDNGAEE